MGTGSLQAVQPHSMAEQCVAPARQPESPLCGPDTLPAPARSQSLLPRERSARRAAPCGARQDTMNTFLPGGPGSPPEAASAGGQIL